MGLLPRRRRRGASPGGLYAYSNVESGSTLNLGANLNIGPGGVLNVQDSGSTLNAQGHALSAPTLYLGWNGNASVSLTDLGQVTLINLYVGNSAAGSDLTLHGGDVINNLINLQNGSVLTVQQTNGIGLTLNGTSLSSLTIDPSQMDLIFNVNTAPNWDFRWADPSSGGNWTSAIDGMIADGEIVIRAPQGYSVDDRGGYTYVDGSYISAIPEPSSIVLGCIACVGIVIGVKRSRRSTVK